MMTTTKIPSQKTCDTYDIVLLKFAPGQEPASAYPPPLANPRVAEIAVRASDSHRDYWVLTRVSTVRRNDIGICRDFQ